MVFFLIKKTLFGLMIDMLGDGMVANALALRADLLLRVANVGLSIFYVADTLSPLELYMRLCDKYCFSCLSTSDSQR